MSSLAPCVVSEFTIRTVLSRLSCMVDSDIARDVASIVHCQAKASRIHELVEYLGPTFAEWKSRTRFLPKPWMQPNVTYFSNPVKQFLKYGGVYYSRDRLCAGVTFGTFVHFDHREVGAVWTTDACVYLYEYMGNDWELVHVLPDQPDPYATWLQHLGGSAYEGNLEERFRSLVVPHFGTHPLARDVVRMRRLSDSAPIWNLVRRTSLSVVASDDPVRLEWTPVA